MKIWKVALLALAVAITGCSDDDDDNDVVAPPVVPVGVTADEATTMTAAVSSVDAITGTISFSLATDEQDPIEQLANIEVMYLGYPPADWQAPASESNFKLRWHQSHLITCTIDSCDGALVEVTPGNYTFTPDAYDWNHEIDTFKYQVVVSGALAETTIDLTAM
ncbi:hypothetical protein [Ferrimonas lipolytica]|uniref:Lipoprotein n=1 Tax=Ferrimonas lipolytica TaxID=2724191 RepID=A0A6H1UJ11_9GAMM|nr:hypothetical protein [Ferrimonas lipolytica]QIZ78600.1 hypothetical protein HER31_17840 [Ferrimonas lipolytica]